MDQMTLFDFAPEEMEAAEDRKLKIVKAEFKEVVSQDWSELFDGFDELYGITFSSGIQFMEKDEKLDADNGLLLCPNHDKLFDQGYITFDDNGAIVISEEVNQRMQMCMNISPDLKIDLSQGNKKYMKFHRENLFKG